VITLASKRETKPLIIAIYGHKNSGKTRLIEYLTRNLVEKGYKIATIKHIHHDDFEIDIQGKDTWRHRKAGATTVIGISRKKVVIFEETPMKDLKQNLYRALTYITKNTNPDIIFLEGFHNVTREDENIQKIILIKDLSDLESLMITQIRNIIGLFPQENINISQQNIRTFKNKEEILNEILCMLK